MDKITIVYKTYKNDIPWMRYSLLSVEKFVRMDYEIIIYCHDACSTEVYSLLEEINIRAKVIPVVYDIHGYIKQMVVKLDCYKDVETKYMCIVDCDVIFIDYIFSNDFVNDDETIDWQYSIKKEDSTGPEWTVWKKAYEDQTKTEQDKHYMSNGSPFIFEKTSLERSAEMFQKMHGKTYHEYCKERLEALNLTPDDPIRPNFMALASVFEEFEWFGFYCHLFEDKLYNFKIHGQVNRREIWKKTKQFWSHGGITEEIKTFLDSRLAKPLNFKKDLYVIGFPRCGNNIIGNILREVFYIRDFNNFHDTDYEDSTFDDNSRVILLYRKDDVLLLDAFFRYTFRDEDIPLSFEQHSKCRTKYKYRENINFIYDYYVQYQRWIDKWITNKPKNSLLIEYDDFMKDPVNVINSVQNICFGFINEELSSKVVKDLQIEYKHTLSNENYQELESILKQYQTPTLALDVIPSNTYLLVVSHGGSATTAFMHFIKQRVSTNCPGDLDGLKHTLPSNIQVLPSRIIYIYGDMDKTMRSLFRRTGGNLSFASIQEYKLKNIKHSSDLPANFEDFEAYTKLVTLENREPVGCLVHMSEWKKVPNVFFIHYEQICTSDTIDDYIGIPKGTCSQFTVMPRVSKVQPYETPEYLETMKGFDLMVQKIITGQPHKSNILIVSFPRSGFHIFEHIFVNYLNIKECACQKNCDVEVNTCVKEDIAFHRAHDTKLELNKEQFNKTIILYRKDVVEQLDAFFRYQFRTFDTEKRLNNDLIKHSSCHELDIPYSEKSDFFRTLLKQYKDWVEKWVTEPTPNSILIEYSDFMKNPQETLDRVQEHLLESKDSDLSAKIVEEMKIEYKHSITLEKYQKLANILLRL
jgi:hypothetical protein